MIIQFVPLEDAQICLDCDRITNATEACPACGSKALHALEQWIKRIGRAIAA